MSTRPPDGCPGCNPEQVMRFLHARGIQVEELSSEVADAPETDTCERCGRTWILMPKNSGPATPVA